MDNTGSDMDFHIAELEIWVVGSVDIEKVVKGQVVPAQVDFAVPGNEPEVEGNSNEHML